MKITKLSPVGAAGLAAGLLLLLGSSAAADNCYPKHSAGFGKIRGLEVKATSQGTADLEVANAFGGPRSELCEEGAYKSFLETFESFAKEAMRAPKDKREKLLRLAIGALKQAPTKVPFKEKAAAASQWRQTRSNLNATADDVGFEKTPLLQGVIDALTQAGAPTATESPATPPDPTQQATTTNAAGAAQPIRIPIEPMPSWAIIKLYEMRDNVKSQDVAAIGIKVQDIINWVENSTKAQQ
jgi:hypothetical protein